MTAKLHLKENSSMGTVIFRDPENDKYHALLEDYIDRRIPYQTLIRNLPSSDLTFTQRLVRSILNRS